jgi:hypothetical protein
MARHIPIALLALGAAALVGACARPVAWAPPPPAGVGYEYRFTGVYQKSYAAGHDTWRVGKVRLVSYYGYRTRSVSEAPGGLERAMIDLPTPGTEADGRFNLHLGEAGEKLEAAR